MTTTKPLSNDERELIKRRYEEALAEFPGSRDSEYREDGLRFIAEIETLLEEKRRRRQACEGDYWAWQGDGEDHLESLSCPVVIHPADLMVMIAEIESLDDEKVGGDKVI